MLDTLQRVLDTVDSSRVQFADMRGYQSEDLSLTVKKGKTEDVSSEKLTGVALSLIHI